MSACKRVFLAALIQSVQEYSMKCHLCGHGSASVSVLPDDPREQPLF